MVRLNCKLLELPIEEIRSGYYSAVYFWREKRILEMENIKHKGFMQIFQKQDDTMLCGIDEALAILRVGTGYWKDDEKMQAIMAEWFELKRQIWIQNFRHQFQEILSSYSRLHDLRKQLSDLWVDTHDSLQVHALQDGDMVKPNEIVMTIEGQGSYFAHLETLYLGSLARCSKIATNVHHVVRVANGKPILYFADRFDRYVNHSADGYAAEVGGATGSCTDAMGCWTNKKGTGTTPHALIAFYHGDTAQSVLDFKKHFPQANAIALVDFHNDCVQTSLECARAFEKSGKSLWGVRLDNSETLVDKSLFDQMGYFKPNGVCAELVYNVRNALDKEGFQDVKIICSGGFNADRVHAFEKAGIPCDSYGIGSAFLQGKCDFTADIVKVNDKHMAKVGRYYRPNPKLRKVHWSEIEES